MKSNLILIILLVLSLILISSNIVLISATEINYFYDDGYPDYSFNFKPNFLCSNKVFFFNYPDYDKGYEYGYTYLLFYSISDKKLMPYFDYLNDVYYPSNSSYCSKNGILKAYSDFGGMLK